MRINDINNRRQNLVANQEERLIYNFLVWSFRSISHFSMRSMSRFVVNSMASFFMTALFLFIGAISAPSVFNESAVELIFLIGACLVLICNMNLNLLIFTCMVGIFGLSNLHCSLKHRTGEVLRKTIFVLKNQDGISKRENQQRIGKLAIWYANCFQEIIEKTRVTNSTLDGLRAFPGNTHDAIED